MHIYICTGVTVAKPNEISRPHLSTYIVISEGQEGAVYIYIRRLRIFIGVFAEFMALEKVYN